MKNKFIAILLTALLFSGFVTRDNDIYYEINKSIDIFGRVYKEAALNYVDPLNPQEFMLAGIEGMLNSLDPYSNFIDANQQKDIDIITKGKYGGIGATVGIRNNNVTVVDLIEGYSAQRQGMRIGDIITKINNRQISKDNFELLSEFLKGEPGTTVNVTIKREGVDGEIGFNLLREEIEIKNLSYYGFIQEDGNIVYLKLSGFTRSAGDEIKKALLELKSKKEIGQIILDLRGNPGGLLDAAIDVSEKFLKKGQLIVSVRGRDTLNNKNYFSSEEPIIQNNEIVVLIDGGTASAAEIVAGALQDHDRAVIIGANSFGKGLVQTIIPLSYNTSLKLTTARYYTPSGRLIQKADYSDKNKVYTTRTAANQTEYETDNKRLVFSAGGIMPDSLVKNESGSGLVERLLAEGIFFRFATYFFNNNSKMKLDSFSEEQMMKKFANYLMMQNFDFVSKAEKLIDQLKVAMVEENLDQQFLDQLEKAKKEIGANHSNEIQKYKDEIITRIREELAARIDGREGRIRESLKYDSQFSTAIGVLKNKKIYNKFLKNTSN